MNQFQSSKKMLPVVLLLENRPCLLVGGGRVAARKGAKLAEANMQLTVVAPLIKESVRSIPGIRLIEREFKESDLDGNFLVFALTDDRALNRWIVELCHRKGVLCSAADGNWPDGDLILPASFSADDLTVSVSTAGRSCRRSRMLRESLSRHVEFLQRVDLFMLGGDLGSTDFQSLEKLKARRAEIENILLRVQGVHEFMILDTCNRFEIVGLVSANTNLELFLKELPHSAKGIDAFHRLAEIAAGLRSGVCGETRIVAQIKESLASAQEKQQAGSFLQSWVDHAFHISKEIRQAVEPQIPAFEIEDLVFQALEKFPSIGKIVIVGRGEIGQGLVHRFPQAVQIGGRSNEEICLWLSDADAVICATGSDELIIREEHRALLKSGAVLIDLSLPRNIDPALPGVIGLSELRSAVQPENEDRLFSIARDIIDAHRAEYERLVDF